MKTLLIILSLLVNTVHFAYAETKQARVYDIGTYVTDLAATEAFYTKVFALKVIHRWDNLKVSLDGKNYQTVAAKGLYLQGAHGMHLEFLESANVNNQHIKQQPINHFAMQVEDVAKTLKLALSLGAKEAFPGSPLQFIKLNDLTVLNTQIIGLDGERIQILQIVSDVKNE